MRVLRGRLKGRDGWISGDLRNRGCGVTKALVHAGGEVELVAIASLEAVDQLELALPQTQKKPPPAC